MRVLASCQPAVGHFQPMAPVAHALVAAGHEVVFATPRPFCGWIQAAGFAAVPAGLDWLESEVDTAFPDLVADGRRLDDLRRGWRSVFARAAQAAMPDLRRVIAEVSPDLVMTESLDLAGPLAAEAAGVPHAVVGAGAPRPLALLADAVRTHWQAARAALALPADPGLHRFSPWLYLDPCPPSLRPYPPAQLPASWRPLRFTDATSASAAPSWLGSLGVERPLVYVTMGTVFNRVQAVFSGIVEALAGLPVDAVVTVGPNGDPAAVPAFGPPGSVRVERFVPQAAVLARAGLVVCHGGFNTTVSALAHGVPVIAIPLGADHHYNAFRVAACGAGLELNVHAATPPLVRSAVEIVLGDDLCRANAARIGREIATMPAPATAIGLLEQVARAGVAARG